MHVIAGAGKFDPEPEQPAEENGVTHNTVSRGRSVLRDAW